MILLNDDLFNITNSWEWTICLNEPVNNIVTLFGQNETQKRKDRLLEHISWKKTFGKKGSFRIINTKYCLQFLRLERGRDEWLFLGAFEVNGYHTTSNGDEVYDLAIMQDCSLNKYAERLIVKYHKKQGPKQAKIMWKTYLQFELSEILGDIYFSVINTFPGYDEVCLDFSKLVSIYSIPYRSWQEALSIINGIYVITDTSNGKQYVGSTYGYNGVWQRWEGYVKTNGHVMIRI